MLEIPVLVTAAWTAIQPVLPIIASKGTEEIVSHAVGDVWEAIKRKFDTKAAAKEALEDLLKTPHDTDVQGQFRVQLKKLLQEDATFTADLSRLLEAAGSDFKAQVIGNGAIAQGTGAKAVGAGGIMIEGGVSGGIDLGAKKKA